MRPLRYLNGRTPSPVPAEARQNKKQNAGAIGALNFFLGWTLVGWVVALVWAMSKDANVPQPSPPIVVTSPAPPLAIPAQKKCPDCAAARVNDFETSAHEV